MIRLLILGAYFMVVAIVTVPFVIYGRRRARENRRI